MSSAPQVFITLLMRIRKPVQVQEHEKDKDKEEEEEIGLPGFLPLLSSELAPTLAPH